MLQNWRTYPIALLLFLTAFTRPEVGDLLELEGFVNAREQARFRSRDQNRIYVLQPGTKAQVEEIQHFPGTGNYGLRIRLINTTNVRDEHNQSLWVYYNVKKPSLKLYSISGNTDQMRETLEQWQTSTKIKALEVRPQTGLTSSRVPTAAVVIQPVQAIPAATTPSLRAPVPQPRPQITAPPVSEMVSTVQRMNRVARDQVSPDPVCRGCVPRPSAQDVTCSAQNNYLEQQMDRLQGQPVLRELLSATPRHPRLEACVREGMTMTGGPFSVCAIGSNTPQTVGTRACTSSRLVRVVQNALSTTVECFAGYLNGNEGNSQLLSETMRNTLALVNLESGFHINTRSATGAAGLGQITEGAVRSINSSEWSRMMAHLQSSSNSACQSLKRMDLKPMRPSRTAVCDRMSFEAGNPVTNMIYTLAHMKQVRRELETGVRRSLRENGIVLGAATQEKLLGALTNWGHNTGSYGISRPVASLLETDAGQRTLKSGNVDEFLRLLKGEVSSFHQSYLSRRGTSQARIDRRKHEASNFYQNVLNKLSHLERKVGRTCSM